MPLIHAFWVSFATALAGLAWILFARSQTGRFQADVLPWLSLPYFIVSAAYLYFGLVEISIETRAAYARIGYLVTTIPQSIGLITFFVIYLWNRGNYGKPE